MGRCGKPRFTYPEREVGSRGRKGRADGGLFSVTWASRQGLKAWGGAVLYSVRIPAWLFPVAGVFYGQMPPFPKKTCVEELWVGRGNGCVYGWPGGRLEAGEEEEGKTHPWTSSVRAKAGL